MEVSWRRRATLLGSTILSLLLFILSSVFSKYLLNKYMMSEHKSSNLTIFIA